MKNKKKTVICCTLTAVLTLTASTPVFADSVWNYRAVADSLEGVNIRSSASENSTIVGYLPTGGSADIIEVGEEWTLVVSGGVQGYVKNEYLATGDQAAYLADVYGYDGVRTDWDGVNFFSQPDGASQVVDTASAGSEYILLEDQGDWLTVQLPDSTIAYVPAEDVQSTTVLARATAAESSYSETSTVSYEDTSYSTDTTYYETEATVYSEPEYYETEAPTYSEPEYYETEAPTYTEPEYYETEAPAYSEPEYYETEAPSYSEPEYYETEAPAYSEPEYYETEAPAYSEPEYYETEAPSVSSSDLDLLAALIYCEAGNQSREGKVAVGAVVMNRVASSSFANTISGVIYESGQFTPAMTGWLDQVLASGAPSDCYEAAQAAMNGENPIGSALYFNAGSGSGIQIGAHQFY